MENIDELQINLIYDNFRNCTNVNNIMLINDNIINKELFYNFANDETFPIIYSNYSDKKELFQLLNEKFPNEINRLSFIFHDPGYNRLIPFLNDSIFFSDSDLSENNDSLSVNFMFLIDLINTKNIQHVDFLACNTLSYPKWETFYNILTNKTNAIIGASSDKTGNLKYGANWIMENTNEDIKNIYFTDMIENYSGTLAATNISASNSLLFKQDTSVNQIQYSTDNGTNWTSIPNTDYPINITNSTTNTILQVKFISSITITTNIGNTNGYFTINSNNVIIDGSENLITINGVVGYTGFLQNGTSVTNGYNDVVIKNFNTTIYSTASLNGGSNIGSGWLCASYFGKNSLRNSILNCSNFGNVSAYSGGGAGGICGSYCGMTGELLISNCYNSGTIISTFSGGIVGNRISTSNGSVTIEKCFNLGNLSGGSSGGICGVAAGAGASSLKIINCYNHGTFISGTTGGICGSAIGLTTASLPISNVDISGCYSTANIRTQSGGLIGGAGSAYYSTPSINIRNCYTSGTIVDTGSGLIANSLQIKNQINIYNCYIANGNWNDMSANNTLIGIPNSTNYNIGNIWTKLYGTNTPYVLSIFQSNIYDISFVNLSSDISVNIIYSTNSGIFTGNSGYAYSVINILKDTMFLYNINDVNGSNISIDISNGTISLNKVPFIQSLRINVFLSKYSNNKSYNYTISSYTLNRTNPLYTITYNAGTNVTTQQGVILIENIDPDIHTINGRNIVIMNSGDLSVAKIIPRLLNFPNISKVFGDPSFQLIDPSSNSSGIFTYLSSNTNVATINNNIVTIINASSCIITCTLNETIYYLSKDISANLMVSKSITTLSNFSNITKQITDGSFILIDPSSNSTGTFSYAISNPYMASINNNVVTLIRVGTATITATQAETNNYYSKDISATIISETCFTADTPILTDQGSIYIQNIDINKHTIKNKKIIAITKNISSSKSLICFEKSAISENIPSKKTIMSKNHQIIYNNQFIKAKDCIDKFKNVHKIPYNNEILYNILLDEYETINVNNMICETLHPENIIAQIYANLSKMTPEEQEKFIALTNKYVKHKNINIKINS